jgi:hypothetical protein
MDMKSQLGPDVLEQQLIAAVSAVLQEEALWADNRSYLTRIIERGKSGSNEYAINEEKWTKIIVERLTALGQRLRFTVSGRQRDWMYDVLWRDLNTSGDWGTTKSVPLALCCHWYVSDIGFPPTEPLDKLMVTRAEHRVLICQHRYSENVFERSKSYIRQCEFTKRGDRYLFLCYQPQSKSFFLAYSSLSNDREGPLLSPASACRVRSHRRRDRAQCSGRGRAKRLIDIRTKQNNIGGWSRW